MKFSPIVGILLFMLLGSSQVFARTEGKRYQTDYRLDSLRTNALNLDIDNLFFFKNNECNGSVMKGYTLPGAWINPKISYQPLPSLKVEGGVHMLIYDGAYRYPNYAYQDISKWKGMHYQKDTHMLPYFRGQLSW